MPDISPIEQFQKVLAIAGTQLKENKIQVRFGPQGKMRFIIDEASLKGALAGIDDATFREIFHNEVGPLLDACIRGALDQYVENSPPFEVEDSTKSANRKAAMRERGELVRKTLVSDDLRGRYFVKVSSKHPRLKVSSWEVAKKLGLSGKETVLHPYATLSFETIRPEQALGIFGWLPFFPSDAIGRSEFCVFDCDEGDLDDLITTLQAAKMALHAAK
jgi:hypothetical protein